MDEKRATTIFATRKGIVALDSPVKLKLLDILKEGSASFEELVEQSGKAKSTISVHLDDLEKMNLVEEKKFPDDKRRKYFVLNSLYLAYSEPPLRDQYISHLDNIAVSVLAGASIKENLFCTMRYGMEAYGIDPNPILKKLGMDMGKRIGRGFRSNECTEILNELSLFWKSHDLGDMSVLNSKGLVVKVDNCYHCRNMPDVGKTLCSMDEGIIEGIISGRTNRFYNVRETECNGTGYDSCKFVIKAKN